jgi:Fe-S-cluster-containing dehydrogenase component
MIMADEETLFTRIIEHLELSPETTRRSFLRATMGTAIALPVLSAWAARKSPEPVIIVDNAEGLVVSDTTRCVGCKRCELACTEFNDGRTHPSLARIKISRNYNFGPRGQQEGIGRGMGDLGNFRVVQDTCRQCPHPVPCATACPNDAIALEEKTKARIVDQKKCTGCRMCLRACPWEMMTFDESANKASKCFLCNGKPECVQACPTAALQYVSWRDLSRAIPIRQATLPMRKDYKSAGCGDCHPIGR